MPGMRITEQSNVVGCRLLWGAYQAVGTPECLGLFISDASLFWLSFHQRQYFGHIPVKPLRKPFCRTDCNDPRQRTAPSRRRLHKRYGAAPGAVAETVAR